MRKRNHMLRRSVGGVPSKACAAPLPERVEDDHWRARSEEQRCRGALCPPLRPLPPSDASHHQEGGGGRRKEPEAGGAVARLLGCSASARAVTCACPRRARWGQLRHLKSGAGLQSAPRCRLLLLPRPWKLAQRLSSCAFPCELQDKVLIQCALLSHSHMCRHVHCWLRSAESGGGGGGPLF